MRRKTSDYTAWLNHTASNFTLVRSQPSIFAFINYTRPDMILDFSTPLDSTFYTGRYITTNCAESYTLLIFHQHHRVHEWRRNCIQSELA